MPDYKLSIAEQIIIATDQLQSLPVDEVKATLISLINLLINSDFNALIQLLYRIDVSEKKLKEVLKNNLQNDSAPLIAGLIIERQQQKIERKKFFCKPDVGEAGEEKW